MEQKTKSFLDPAVCLLKFICTNGPNDQIPHNIQTVSQLNSKCTKGPKGQRPTPQPLYTTDAISLLRDSLRVFHSKSVPKCVRDRMEGRYRVSGASAVKMGPVTLTVTFIVTSRHFPCREQATGRRPTTAATATGRSSLLYRF
jgi:hypothetical protein